MEFQLHFELMSLDDLPLVDCLEQASFSDPWPKTIFRHLLEQDPSCFFWVARPFSRRQSNRLPPDSAQDNVRELPSVLAYGGYRLWDHSAEILNIATHPDWRQRGIGERFLLKMLEELRMLDVESVLLEVRPSNAAARHLYAKHGFEQIDLRRRYYRDGEDAFVMRLCLQAEKR
jgi:ribosomal-protein-alanine N-acetyltransferase